MWGCWVECEAHYAAVRGGNGDLAAHVRLSTRPANERTDLDGFVREREHPALSAQQARNPVEAPDDIARVFPQRSNEEVAHGVTVERSLRREARLQDITPGSAPLGVFAQCAEG